MNSTSKEMTTAEEPPTLLTTRADLKVTVKELTKPFKSQIVWRNLIGFAFFHISCLYGLYLIITGQCCLATYIWGLALLMVSGISITLGAHRLWSHRSYKATKALRLFLLFGQTIAGQNSLWEWVRDHRQHHKFSETDADPHDATRGFWFSHIGWLMMKKHPEVIAKGKLIDLSDLEADPYIMLQKKYYLLLYLLFAFLLPISVPCLCWGETLHNSLFTVFFFRSVAVVNGTWCVNSFAHLWGTRPYAKEIGPVESPFVSLIACGEGWHNYHHTFPWDCNAAEFGTRLNVTGSVLRFFERLGLAYDLRYATPEMVRSRAEKRGDGTWVPVGQRD